ncbi:MAG: 8-oxoguanine deaminase [Cyanobacteria bacterium J06632_22]
MATLLVKNAHTVVTMDEQRREIRRGGLYVRDSAIEQVGPTDTLPTTADQVIDLNDRQILLPGLVNTHHHFFQNLTRAVPAGQNSDLFGWLQALYPVWSKLTPEGIRLSAQLAAVELLLSGCTTASDHLYLFPNGCTLDDEIEAVQATGLRFHASRGSMSVGERQGGHPPDSLVEAESSILKDSQRLIEQYHDASRYAMLRIVLAPCSPFSVSTDLMRASAEMARSYGVRLHTHLAETAGDVAYSLEKFGQRPGDYAAAVGWLGEDVWHTHCVKLSDDEIATFGQTGTGVVHCPSSNMRLASGIAPIRSMLDHGVPVGLGVDGAASSDAGHLFQEARMALLAARVRSENATDMTARQALELATLGGARVLGRDDIGALAPGMAADFVTVDLDCPAFAGTAADPVAALLLCQVGAVTHSIVNGQWVVRDGQVTTLNVSNLLKSHQKYAQWLTA